MRHDDQCYYSFVAGTQVNDEVKPKTLLCRKLPLSLQDDMKREIDKLVERNVLVPVTERTEWVSQMAVVRKSNGKLRICIDPQPLNTALMREHYRSAMVNVPFKSPTASVKFL
jgi:hypothetical protein